MAGNSARQCSRRICPHHDARPPNMGSRSCRRRTRRAGARRLPPRPISNAGQGAYLQPVFDWTGFYIGGHTGYGRGSSNAMLADPAVATSSKVFSGLIGGVQGGYNCPAVLRAAARRRSRSHLSELSAHELRRLAACDRRAPIVDEQRDYRRHRARPHRLCQRALACLRHRRLRLGRRALSQHAYGRQRGKADPRPARLGRRRRTGICLRAALERAARISLQPVRTRQHSLPIGHAIQLDAGFPAAAHRPQPQGRLAGIARAGRRRPI